MKKKIICIFVMTLLIVTVSPAVGIINVFPSNDSTVEKTGAEDYMMTNLYERQKLVASDSTTLDGFGNSVSIDGDYAIIGANGDDSSYVFKRDGTAWTEQDKLNHTSCGTYSNTLLLRLLEQFPFLERFLTLLIK